MTDGLATPEELRKAYEEYAFAVGRVVFAWNSLQETLSRIFDVVVDTDSRISQGIWHRILSDKTQRDVLKAAIDSKPAHLWEKRLPKAREDMIWLLREATKAGEQRNNAIHAPCNFAFGAKSGKKFSVIQAVPHSGNSRAKNLRDKILLDEFDHYACVAAALNDYAHKALRALVDNATVWPAKPVLPTLAQSRSRKAKPNLRG